MAQSAGAEHPNPAADLANLTLQGSGSSSADVHHKPRMHPERVGELVRGVIKSLDAPVNTPAAGATSSGAPGGPPTAAGNSGGSQGPPSAPGSKGHPSNPQSGPPRKAKWHLGMLVCWQVAMYIFIGLECTSLMFSL